MHFVLVCVETQLLLRLERKVEPSTQVTLNRAPNSSSSPVLILRTHDKSCKSYGDEDCMASSPYMQQAHCGNDQSHASLLGKGILVAISSMESTVPESMAACI